jgi:hypothetical protein
MCGGKGDTSPHHINILFASYFYEKLREGEYLRGDFEVKSSLNTFA